MNDTTIHRAVEAVGDLVFTVDDEGTFVEWNDAMGETVGGDDHLAGTALPELFTASEGSVADALDAALDTGRETVRVTLGGDGHGPHYDLRLARLGADGDHESDAPEAAAVAGVASEITRRQGADVAERERVLREMYEIVADRDRTFTARVEALLDLGCRVLGTDYGTLSAIEGDRYTFEVVQSPEDTIQTGETVPLSATNCERAVTTERTLVLADIEQDAPDLAERAGFTEWGISCYLGAPVYADDELYGTFCFYDTEARSEPFSEWEVTLVDLMSRWVSAELDRRETTERLRRTNERLEQFATVVSHDLRTPLSVINGSLELAERTGEREHFERCRRTVERMERLVDDLLSLARAGETIDDPTPVSLASVAERAWQESETGGAALAVETDFVVSADERRLQQLLANLFRNSVEHGTTADGNESVSVRVGTLVGRDGFYVEDDGSGIDEAEREAVFERGYTTGEDGTGFGLAIVERIAEAHGWEVAVTDSDEGGTQFEFAGVDVVSGDGASDD